LKRDLGRVLLAVETAQAQMMKPAEAVAAAVELSPEERAAALLGFASRISLAACARRSTLAGIIGEDNNTLVAYLAGVAEAGTAPCDHHPERKRCRKNHAHGRGVVILPGRGPGWNTRR